MNDTAPLVIVYHADCLDGAAAAWVVSKAKGLEKDPGRPVTYIPYGHHDTHLAQAAILDALETGIALYFVDVAPTRDFLRQLVTDDRVTNIHILDHHASAAEKLANYPPSQKLRIDIDSEKPSAAGMIWQCLLNDEPMPDILKMIDKMDGSARGLQTVDDFAAAAMIDTHDIGSISAAFDALRTLAFMTFNEMSQKGCPLVTEQDRKIDALLAKTGTVQIALAPDTPLVAVPIVEADPATYGRRISSRLVELGKSYGVGIAMTWTQQDNGAVSVSIRSDGEPDVSKIAAFLAASMNLNGGGHPDAAAIHFANMNEFTRKMSILSPA